MWCSTEHLKEETELKATGEVYAKTGKCGVTSYHIFCGVLQSAIACLGHTSMGIGDCRGSEREPRQPSIPSLGCVSALTLSPTPPGPFASGLRSYVILPLSLLRCSEKKGFWIL